MTAQDEGAHVLQAPGFARYDVRPTAVDAPSTARTGRVATLAVAARLLDICLIVLSGLLAWAAMDAPVVQMPAGQTGAIVWASAVAAAWYFFLELHGAYAHDRISDMVHDLRAVVRASLMLAATIAIAAYLVNWELSRMLVGITFAGGAILILTAHLVTRHLLKRGYERGRNVRGVVAVGSRSAVADLTEQHKQLKAVGLKVVAACVPDSEEWESIDGVGRVRSTSALREVVMSTGADHVFLLHGAGESSRHVRRIAWSLEGTEAQLAVVPQLTDIAHGRVRPRPVAGLPLIELQQPQLSGPQAAAKRAVDIVGALTGLVLLSPLWISTALLIKLSGGPVFYRQTRVGRDGRQFKCWKFRTMSVGADDELADLSHLNQAQGPRFKLHRDPRVTAVGKYLRRHSLDEVPQFLNVLVGDMSLVGPRPPLPGEVEKYHPDLARRLKVRPGMTGLWQISGRSDLDALESERLDLYYVDNWSISHDVYLLWRTLGVVISGRGAY